MLPVEDNGSGVRVFYSEQVERDAKDLPQALVKTMLEALADKRGASLVEHTARLRELEASNAKAQATVAELIAHSTGLEEAKCGLEERLNQLRRQLEEEQALRLEKIGGGDGNAGKLYDVDHDDEGDGWETMDEE